ncbi:hypothetical protein HMPREF2955_02525 [Prevotella sp. HMSC073D09]|nr:hypothetical protein HMPREF2955_02525 [Prevotella sp. HMSC073D09]
MQCVLMLIAVRFGAKCRVFWCKMRGKNKRFGQHFFVVADANLASFFFKEKCKNIVNGKKLRRKAPDVVRHFHHSGAFYIGFQGIFF